MSIHGLPKQQTQFKVLGKIVLHILVNNFKFSFWPEAFQKLLNLLFEWLGYFAKSLPMTRILFFLLPFKSINIYSSAYYKELFKVFGGRKKHIFVSCSPDSFMSLLHGNYSFIRNDLSNLVNSTLLQTVEGCRSYNKLLCCH